ncbi:fucose 4-O-acetylase [Secundilactobacillus pentosiphilus]|uniref:Fucose 4-O-acetylase n=1 Tax=Secundilactobacillus pentosiphilus TaxID=1714682 RepID=A0A1Z5ITS6_9LACO|nr:acyltransferase family protein [Secundilactobacillus pentosiphilus]GAX05144.1 fucose 4-O-acetylase [Secundilactobacillus pentosiphilus]
MNERIDWVDVAKGLGILLVIYGHAIGGIMNSSGVQISRALYDTYNVIYGFHMPLFFFLSGLFASKWVQREWHLAFKQKALTLVIPYFIWTFITGTVMAISKRFTNSGLGFRNVLWSPIAPFSEYWFLYVLFFSFVIYYFGIRIIGKSGLFSLAIVLFFLRPFIYHFWIFDAFSLDFLFFMVGTAILQRKSLKRFLLVSKVKFFCSILIFIFVNIIYVKVLSFDNYLFGSYFKIFTISVGILFAIYLSQFIVKSRWLNNAVSYLGRCSMAIYVMHLIPIAGSRIVAIKFLKVSNTFGLSIIISIIALVTCLVGYIILNKTWLGRLSFGQIKKI